MAQVFILNISLLNITSIMTRFVPLSFLLSLTISIIRFERQQELMILWTTGLAKIKVANVFLFVGFCSNSITTCFVFIY